MSITLLKKRPLESTEDGIAQSTKVFLRKTAKGKIVKVLREHYLRADIPCGSKLCEECADLYALAAQDDAQLQHQSGMEVDDYKETTVAEANSSKNAPVLSREGREANSASKSQRHYLLPDTNVFLHQMDVLEAKEFGPDVIVLQTVLDEVRHRSLPLFNRLQALLAEDSRRFSLFSNEARPDTFIQRKTDESPNDRNDRAIRHATKWFNAHISLAAHHSHSDPLLVLLLTDDAANFNIAQSDAIPASKLRDYVSALDQPVLLDLVSTATESSFEQAQEPKTLKTGGKTVFFPEHLPASTLQVGIKAGKLLQGYFAPNPYNFLEGSVNVPSMNKPVLLVGREHMNRATLGDSVAVELLPESEWRASAEEVLDQDVATRNENPDESDEEGDDPEEQAAEAREEKDAADTTNKTHEKLPTGKVVGIFKRAWRPFVCHLDRTSLGPSAMDSIAAQNVFAVPVDRKLPKIRIRTRQVANLAGQKFLVSIDAWDVTTRHPSGHFVRALGAVESKEAEIESLLLEFDVPYRPFPKAILDCLPFEGDSWVVPPKTPGQGVWKNREDLRDLTICSIDPIGCQDIDDALHARRLPNGRIQAGVHIADVSHFVHPDNPMDAEAASRGTTVYLVDKRIDMLPPLLGTNLCSLRPYVERLAFSVFWEMDDDANIFDIRFTKSVIASKAAFSYEDAQKRKDDPSQQDDITKGIRLLNTIAQKLKAKRMAAGALNLASPEVKIHMESAENTGPIDVEQKKSLETNSLVEEFMLLANISVAQRIYDQFPQTAVLRRHLPPPAASFEALQDVLKKRKGMDLETGSSRALADSLDTCVDPNNPDFNTLVRIMATRCMLPAEYFCSGSVGKDTFGHYGLATHIYTHFTSPIRRYADVLVHRELNAAINNTPLHSALHSSSFVDKVMENINKRHSMGQKAGRASIEFYVALALRGKEEAAAKSGAGVIEEEAYVIRAFRNGLAVFVTKFGLEGLITFKKPIDFDPENYNITVDNGKGDKVTIGVFDKVKVKISVDKDKNTQRGRVKMSLTAPIQSAEL